MKIRKKIEKNEENIFVYGFDFNKYGGTLPA